MQDMHQHYNAVLVVLSYLVSVLGSFTALQFALGIPRAQTPRQRWGAVLAAGTAMGGGAIWAMHFIAMLACNMGVQVTYDVVLTAVSAVLAIAACSLGLAIVSAGSFRLLNLMFAGVLMGLGVAGMHYLGMSAMLTSAQASYDGGVVEYSLDAGQSWLDVGPLFEAGGYDGAIWGGGGNPLAGRAAFVGHSHGYGASRANLGALAGRDVRFRFRIGTDRNIAEMGWFIDDIRIYSCVPRPPAAYLPAVRR